MAEEIKQTPLLAAHEKLGARIVPFAGWNMPIQYEGIIAEHKAVRENFGVFDISHMGQFRACGEGSCGWLNGLLTNDLGRLQVGDGQYTLMLNERGGVIDDLIVYRTGEAEFFLVVNASKIAEDFAWLTDRLAAGIQLTNESNDFAGIAVQGPGAAEAFSGMTGGRELPKRFGISNEGGIVVCRTGYTGEDGFELFCPVDDGIGWWEKAIDAGAKPCGLGARDSLRLEKCYPLNGTDLSSEHTPIEAGLGFFVDLESGDFVGRDVLTQQKVDGPTRRLVAIKMTEKGPPPRHGYGIFSEDGQQLLGELTSGGLSPSLGIGVGMGYVPNGSHKVGTPVKIEVRGRRFGAEIVKKPFL
ncbi:MAG: aminomethyltransferase [Verrucomicrobiales bacterium]